MCSSVMVCSMTDENAPIETVKGQKQERKVLHPEDQKAMRRPFRMYIPQVALDSWHPTAVLILPNMRKLQVLRFRYGSI